MLIDFRSAEVKVYCKLNFMMMVQVIKITIFKKTLMF